MHDTKKWGFYHINVRLGLPNEEAPDNMPWARKTAGARLARFLNLNGLLPGEIMITEHHVNNGGMHYYVLLYSDQQNQDFVIDNKIQIFDA